MSSYHLLVHLLAFSCTFVVGVIPSLDAVDEVLMDDPIGATAEETFGFQNYYPNHLHHLPSLCSRWSLSRHHTQLDFLLLWELVLVSHQMQLKVDAIQSIKALKSFNAMQAAVELREEVNGEEQLPNLLLCTSCGRSLWFNRLENSLKVQILRHRRFHLFVKTIVKGFERWIATARGPQGHTFEQAVSLFLNPKTAYY